MIRIVHSLELKISAKAVHVNDHRQDPNVRRDLSQQRFSARANRRVLAPILAGTWYPKAQQERL
jgi:hypothetical protein